MWLLCRSRCHIVASIRGPLWDGECHDGTVRGEPIPEDTTLSFRLLLIWGVGDGHTSIKPEVWQPWCTRHLVQNSFVHYIFRLIRRYNVSSGVGVIVTRALLSFQGKLGWSPKSFCRALHSFSPFGKVLRCARSIRASFLMFLNIFWYG